MPVICSQVRLWRVKANLSPNLEKQYTNSNYFLVDSFFICKHRTWILFLKKYGLWLKEIFDNEYNCQSSLDPSVYFYKIKYHLTMPMWEDESLVPGQHRESHQTQVGQFTSNNIHWAPRMCQALCKMLRTQRGNDKDTVPKALTITKSRCWDGE